MATSIHVALPATFTSDVLAMVLEQAEQALAELDCVDGEPWPALVAPSEPEVLVLRSALSDLVKAHPGAAFELEAVSDRLRQMGLEAAALDLHAYPHLLQVVRLSLEIFFRSYPDLAAYERSLLRAGEEEAELPASASELWEAHRRMLVTLRGSLS